MIRTSFFSLVIFFGCQLQTAAPPSLPAPNKLPADKLVQINPPAKSYSSMKKQLEKNRARLLSDYNSGRVDLDSVRQSFTTLLVDSLIPYWYGTDWSFEGHTETPKNGSIACGYFVSTTLRDMGVHLNRYRLAQQAPAQEARIIQMNDSVQIIQVATDSLQAHTDPLLLLRDGLYFIGLGEGHVGYLYIKNRQLIALHANYVVPSVVIAQPFEASVYAGFDTYYIADITWNDRLLTHWLNKRHID